GFLKHNTKVHFLQFQSEGFSKESVLTYFITSDWLDHLQKFMSKLAKSSSMVSREVSAKGWGRKATFFFLFVNSFLGKLHFPIFTKMPLDSLISLIFTYLQICHSCISFNDTKLPIPIFSAYRVKQLLSVTGKLIRTAVLKSEMHFLVFNS